jgi:zinc protease
MSARRLLPLALSLGAVACGRAPQPETPAPVEQPAPAPPPPAPLIDTAPPRLGVPAPLQLPPVQTRELPNGLKIALVEHHELPVADFVLVVRSGSERDPARHSGLATLTADMLTEGAGTRTSLQISDQEAFLGASLGAASGWDATRIVLHTPTAQLDSALALFADVALRPTFPARELDRLRKERLTELLQMRDRAPDIADRAFSMLVFGEAHPYGRSLVGSERTVANITRSDVQRFYRANFRPNNAVLLAVGDLTMDDLERRARALFGAWERGTVPPPTFTEPPKAANTTIYLIDKPGAPQSSVRIGGVGVPRSTDDYFALVVANTVLGGSFTSRLMQNLRESKGYTYGARSQFDMRQSAGPFRAAAEVTGAKTDSALIEFMKELRAIRDTVPRAELEKTKRYLQLQLPGRLETTSDIAAQLVPLATYDIPLDFYNSYAQRIEQVTQADVRRVMDRYVNPDQAVVVIVGDRKSIQSGLSALKFGPVELRDISGQRVPVP